MKTFLEQFFAGTTHAIELRTLPKVNRIFSRDQGALSLFAINHTATNVFFGCATRENGEEGKKTYKELPALWIDADFKITPEEELRELIRRFPLQPSLVICSGGGLHVYWLLEEAADPQDPRCKLALQGLAAALKADPQAAEIARVLRLPGSYNYKYPHHPQALIEEANWQRRYGLGNFGAWQEQEPARKATGKIKEGGRNNALAALAGSMRRQGHEAPTIEAALRATNAAFEPPLPEEEMRAVVASVCRYPAGELEVVTREVEIVPASSIEPEPLLWYWENRIPLGKLTVFFGMPGTGKSTISLDIVARATKALDWPDAPNRYPPSEVLMLISEDDLSDVVIPRLMAAGADLDKVFFATQTVVTGKKGREERGIALDTDMTAIESILLQHPGIRLIVIDPLGSYLGLLKKNVEEEIRGLLLKIKKLAEQLKVAVISIDHFNKNIDQAALHRLSGAGALSAVPRAVWAFVKDADDPEKLTRLMLNAKLNVVSEAKAAGLAFRIGSVDFIIKNVPSNQPKIEWLGKNKGDLDEILHRKADPEEGKEKKCVKLFQELLAGAPLTASATKAAENAGFSYATIKRARARYQASLREKELFDKGGL
jgi:hypothetical protein